MNEEQNYNTTKKPVIFLILKILAPVVLILGIVLIILGTAVFPENFNGHSVAPNPALFAPGMIILCFSIPMFICAFLPEINKTSIKTAAYIQEQNKDSLKSITDTSADIASDAVTKTTAAVKKGLKDQIYCKHCGTLIDEDSKFCKKCGKEQ